jgi:MGT family glycosyltransferase
MFQPFADNFDPQNFKFVGPSLLPRPEAPVFPFEALTGKPLIYISLGTIYNARPEFYRACFKAFGATAWQVVMAVGSQVSKELLGQAPGNFIIREVVPQLEVLKRASLFITHGGMNSVSEALYNNVPMVVLPQSADQPWIGKRVAELGAGQMLLKRKVSPSHLRQAAEKVLSQPSYVQAATLIGNSLRLAGGYQKAVDEIEAYKQKQGIISKHSV